MSKGTSANSSYSVETFDVDWRGLRCHLTVEGQFSGLFLDIRTQPGDSNSSVVVIKKPLKDNGTASVVVDNEDLEGVAATIVLLDANDILVAQISTTIGRGEK